MNRPPRYLGPAVSAGTTLLPKNLAGLLTLAAIAGLILIASPPQRILAEEVQAANCTENGEPDENDTETESPTENGAPQVGFGTNSPVGVAGTFNQITTGCEYDPLSRNEKHQVDDIVIPSVSAYPLRMTRYYNSRSEDYYSGAPTMCVGWTHEYAWAGSGSNGAIAMPDGTTWDPRCGLPKGVSERWEDNTHFRLADGGTVVFDQTRHLAVAIVDPFGKTTTIEYDQRGQISKVTEPGGRFLQFTYVDNPLTTELHNTRLLTEVDAYDGRGNRMDWVQYRYCPIDPGPGYQHRERQKMMLTEVHYSDGTVATYTYLHDNIWEGGMIGEPVNPKELPLLWTAQDVRYRGPMRSARFSYQGGTVHIVADGAFSASVPHGIVKKEMTLDGNTVVSQIEGNYEDRTEITRGHNGTNVTRSFHYSPMYYCEIENGVPQCDSCGGAENPQLLLSYTDFQNHTTYLGYDGNNFVNSVRDARDHTTTYDRGAQIGEIHKITHPDTTFIQYDYEHPTSSAPDLHYVTRITDERGNITEHTRDPDSHLIIHTDYKDSRGTRLAQEDIEYNALGQVTKHQMKNRAYVHYRYDSRGLLTDNWSPTLSASPVETEPKTTYIYYGANDPVAGNAWIDRVKTEIDPRGNVTVFEYDRLLVNGQSTGAPCPGRGLVTKISHPNDTHNGAFPSGTYQLVSYNKWGDKMWEENELRQRTTYEYDDYGRVIKITDPLGHYETFDYTPTTGGNSSPYAHTTNSVKTHTSKRLPNPVITENDYDENYCKISTTVGFGTSEAATAWFHYDEVGNQDYVTDPRGSGSGDADYTTYSDYDNRNRKWRVREPLGHTTVFHFDNTNNITSIDRPDGKREFKEYDGLSRITKTKVPMLGDGPAESDYVITQFVFYPAEGQSASLLWKVIDGNQHETEFQYEPSGLKETMFYPALTPGATRDTQTWTYDANKNLIARKTTGGEIQTFTYDSRNRKKSMRWNNQIDWSDFDYDAVGRLSWAQNPYATVTRQYDEAGRLKLDRQTFPEVTPTPAPIIRPMAIVSRMTHGEAGTFDIPLPLTGEPGIECRSGGPDGNYRIVATFGQPITFNDVAVSSGIGGIMGVSSVPTSTGGTEVTIDLGKVSDAQKIVVGLFGVSDGENWADIEIPMHVLVGDVTASGVVRETDVALVDSHVAEDVTADNCRYNVSGTGVIDTSDRALVAANADLGIAIQPFSATLQHDVSYGYDNDGRVTHLYVPDTDYDYTLTYDGLGRLWQIKVGTTVQFDYQYDKASNVTHRVNHLNGTSIDYGTRDNLNRLTDLTINVPNGWFTHERYGYDTMNRLISVTRDEEPYVRDWFEYYFDGELKHAQYAQPASLATPTPGPTPNRREVTYDLDKCGNRTAVTENNTPHFYDPNPLNQYDPRAHGGGIQNGLEHEISSYAGVQYNYLNDTRLAEVLSSYTSDQYQLGYDALGRCVKRTFNHSVTYYVYDGERPILEFDPLEFTPESTSISATTNLYGIGIDEIIARNNNGAAQYPMQDHEGSVIVVTGGDGSILEWYRYDAFGAPTIYHYNGSHQPVVISTTSINNRFLFTGREYNATFGFYEYRARAYHPTIGRFMSEDPGLFDAGDYNLFRYCHNDPEDLTDPMGLVAGTPLHDQEQKLTIALVEKREVTGSHIPQVTKTTTIQLQGKFVSNSNLKQLVWTMAHALRDAYQRFEGQYKNLELSTYISQKKEGSQNFEGHPLSLQIGKDPKGTGMNASYLYNKKKDPEGLHDPSRPGFRVIAGMVAQKHYRYGGMSKRDQGEFFKAGYDGYTVTPGRDNANGIQINPYHYPDAPR